MRCLHPLIRKYINHFDGKEYVQECPCGKCLACLHNEQDSWCIRLRETCDAYKDFVYDTLTFNQDSITYFDVTEQVLDERRIISPESMKLLERYSFYDKETGEIRYYSPAIDRSVVRDWIRQGRELFVHHHKYRPKMKYFVVEEYGPKTSRPHFHLLMFGISKIDYIRFFKKKWRSQYGFTKTQFIQAGTDKDRSCISRYVSKYVSKGVFESPLVKDGFSPKPFRSISHGIGAEYLENSIFDWFRSDVAQFYRDLCLDMNYEPSHQMRFSHLKYLIKKGIYENFNLPSEAVLSRLVSYFDSNGYRHSCPRYYKARLLGLFKPNLLSYAVQAHLLESARVYDNKALQEFSRSLGYHPKVEEVADSYAGFGRKLYNILYDKYFASRCLQAKIEAKRVYDKLKNHYGRAMNIAFVA